jgi:hypothetical protein
VAAAEDTAGLVEEASDGADGDEEDEENFGDA